MPDCKSAIIENEAEGQTFSSAFQAIGYETDGANEATFNWHVITEIAHGSILFPVDWDKDGDLDILVGSDQNGTITWVENPTNP